MSFHSDSESEDEHSTTKGKILGDELEAIFQANARIDVIEKNAKEIDRLKQELGRLQKYGKQCLRDEIVEAIHLMPKLKGKYQDEKKILCEKLAREKEIIPQLRAKRDADLRTLKIHAGFLLQESSDSEDEGEEKKATVRQRVSDGFMLDRMISIAKLEIRNI